MYKRKLNTITYLRWTGDFIKKIPIQMVHPETGSIPNYPYRTAYYVFSIQSLYIFNDAKLLV